MKTKLIREPVFGTFIRYVWNCSLTEFVQWLKDKFDLEIKVGGGNYGLTVREERNDGKEALIVIWTEDESQIYHEISHAVFWWMDERGVPRTEDTEEVFTYLLDFYIKKIKKARKKRKRAKK